LFVDEILNGVLIDSDSDKAILIPFFQVEIFIIS